ncbi:MAG: helix-turn-helix domain-containing protein [Mucilaginibacter polytrichastri]|nr:helix-turn-helix domain-containing protein [Mucilaginibacter polytrichastri]
MDHFKIAVIKTEQDYDHALEHVAEIFDAKPGSAKFEELELLGVLIRDYEDRNHPVTVPEPIEVIKLKMQEKGLKNKDLIPLIGSKSHVSGILTGKKEITLKMARKLHEVLKVPADVFFGPATL